MSVVSRDELHDLAGEVASRLETGHLLVRVAKLEVESEEPQGGNVSVGAEINLTVSSPAAHQTSIACRSAYNLVARKASAGSTSTSSKSDDHDAVMWRVSVTVDGQWGLETTEGLTDEHAQAFAMKIGVMTLHPYARVQIQNAVLATGWPAYVIDVLQSPESIFADEDNQVDLDGVGLFANPSDSN